MALQVTMTFNKNNLLFKMQFFDIKHLGFWIAKLQTIFQQGNSIINKNFSFFLKEKS